MSPPFILHACHKLMAQARKRATRNHGLPGSITDIANWVGQLVGTFTTTLDGRMVSCNRVLAEMLGHDDPSDLVGKDVALLYHDPADRKDFLLELDQARQLRNREILLKHRTGRPVHILENARMVDIPGRPLEIQGLVIDISSIRRDELEQRMLVNTYRQLMNRVRDAVMVVRDLRVLYLNPSAERLFSPKALNRELQDLFRPGSEKDRKRLQEAVEKADPDVPIQVDAALADGGTKPLLLFATGTWHAGAPATQITLHDPEAVQRELQDRLRMTLAEEANRVLREEMDEHKRTQDSLRGSRRKLKSIIDSSLDMIMTADKDGRVMDFNPAASLRFGYEVEEVMGKPIAMFFADPEEHARITRELERYGSFSGEVLNVDREGRAFTCFLNSSYLIDEDGRSLGSMGVSRDVTQARADRERLRLSEERYRDLFDNASDLIHSVDTSGKILFVNAAWTRSMGYSKEEACTLNVLDLLPAEKREGAMLWLLDPEPHVNHGTWTGQFIAKDGRILQMEGSSSVRKEEGKVAAIRSIFRDVTATHDAQLRLHRLAAKEQALFQSNEHLFWTVDRRIALTSFNKGYEHMVQRMHGHEPHINTDPERPRELFADPEYHRFWEEKYRMAFAGQTVKFETDRMDTAGERVCNEIYLSPVFEADGTVNEVFGIGHEVTAERLAERQVREQGAKLNALFESSANVMIWSVDQRMDITACNRFFMDNTKQVTGLQLGVGDNVLEGFKKTSGPGAVADLAHFYQDCFLGRLQQHELSVTLKNGITRWLEIFMSPIRIDGTIKEVSCLAHDITEKKRAEQAMLDNLREKEVLLKEVHHRVKNNLQIISSIFSLQRDHLGNDPRAAELLLESQNRIRSMAFIHESLYQNKSLSQIDLADYMGSLCRNLVMSYSLTDKVALRTDLRALPMDIDKAIPCGLILNELVSNALKHAFPNGNGEIYLALETKTGQVRMLVEDNGCGFPTDRPLHRGLGLELVEMLTGQLDGQISRTNGAGGSGTRYLITFDRT